MKMLKLMLLGLLSTMPIAHAGFIGALVKVPVGGAFIVGGALLGNEAWKELNKTNSVLNKIEDKLNKSDFSSSKKAATQLLKDGTVNRQAGEDALNEITGEGNRAFNKYGKVFGYGVGTIVCVTFGWKFLKSAF
jgi:hypothetical protein